MKNLIKTNSWENMIVKMVFKHLKDNCMGYKTHWYRAMSMSIALFIHAWIPDLYQTYASDKINNKK